MSHSQEKTQERITAVNHTPSKTSFGIDENVREYDQEGRERQVRELPAAQRNSIIGEQSIREGMAGVGGSILERTSGTGRSRFEET